MHNFGTPWGCIETCRDDCNINIVAIIHIYIYIYICCALLAETKSIGEKVMEAQVWGGLHAAGQWGGLHAAGHKLQCNVRRGIATRSETCLVHTESLVPLIFYWSKLFYLLTVGVEGHCCNWWHSETHTHTHCRTPLDEGSASRKDLHLTTHNIQNRQTSMSLVVFEPVTPASERPQTHALNRAVAGIGTVNTKWNMTIWLFLVQVSGLGQGWGRWRWRGRERGRERGVINRLVLNPAPLYGTVPFWILKSIWITYVLKNKIHTSQTSTQPVHYKDVPVHAVMTIISAYTEDYAAHKTTICRHNADILEAKEGGTYGYHFPLKCWISFPSEDWRFVVWTMAYISWRFIVPGSGITKGQIVTFHYRHRIGLVLSMLNLSAR